MIHIYIYVYMKERERERYNLINLKFLFLNMFFELWTLLDLTIF